MDLYQRTLRNIRENHFPDEYVLARIRKVRQFMEQHHARRISLDDMSNAACFSRYHFIRMFKTTYGRSPHQFLRDIRINRAKKMLRTGVPVTEVCFAIGYDSVSTFSGLFKKATGLSPIAYQQQYKSNIEEVTQ